MQLVRTVERLRAALEPARREGRSVGLVPTMGALHAGHLALIERARAETDVVVVTLFVNPAQFDERADLERYPRDEHADARAARAAGADVLFAPAVEEVYPPGFASEVSVAGVSEPLEGVFRGAAHFRGVATVVTKLLCMARPDAAYFGRKDAQQLAVIRRVVADLNLPVEVRPVDTVRDGDGLALSSRNALLSPAERLRARAIPRALRAACELAADGERSAATLIAAAREQLERESIQPDYVALVDADSFAALQSLDGRALLLIAARVGSVRLIDNVEICSVAGAEPRETEVLACSA